MKAIILLRNILRHENIFNKKYVKRRFSQNGTLNHWLPHYCYYYYFAMVFLPLAVCLFSIVLSLVKKIREVFARMLKRYMPKMHYIIYFNMKQVQSVCGDIVYSIRYSLCWSTTAFFITVTVTLYHATKYLAFYVFSWNKIPLNMANFPVVFISFFFILFCLLYDKWQTLLLVNEKKAARKWRPKASQQMQEEQEPCVKYIGMNVCH